MTSQDQDRDPPIGDPLHAAAGAVVGGAVESVLVTGGGSGIGAALARRLADRGCTVLVTGRRAAPLHDVAGGSPHVTACVGDVTDATHRSALVDALAELPGPRAIVHAAGSFRTGSLDTLTVEAWRNSFELNVEARWLLTRACAPLLDDGRVLFIGSDAGAAPRSGAAAYSIAQAASETLRRSFQAEWAERSTAVGAFRPGLVDTDMVRGFLALSPEEFPARTAYEEYVASGRVATAESVARFAAWLLLDVPAERFSGTEWDIRDTDHHTAWTDRPLYPDERHPG